MSFEYCNLSDRPAGRFVTLAGRFVPGIRAVQEDVRPFAARWQQANQHALAGSGPLWVALGDSMTQGIGASAPERGWVGQLAARFAAAGRPVRVLNLAVTGARVADLLQRQLPVLAGLAVEPALVTVLAGSNDLVRARYRRELPADFELLLQRLPPGAVVGNLPNPRAAAAAVDASIHRAVRTRGLVLADFRRAGGSWRGKLAPDFFHPNDLGYADLADVFARAIGLPAGGG